MSDAFVHDSAIVDPGASVGTGTKIWHFSHVSSGARIGENVVIGQNVFVASTVVVGDGCKIQNNVSLYDGVLLDDGVFCGPSVVFTNVINPRAHVVRKDELRKTSVRTGASIGANATIVCGIEIGRYAFVAAGAVVTRDVPDFALVAGNPARHVGWMSAFGHRLELPLDGEGAAQCPGDGSRYILKDGVCRQA